MITIAKAFSASVKGEDVVLDGYPRSARKTYKNNKKVSPKEFGVFTLNSGYDFSQYTNLCEDMVEPLKRAMKDKRPLFLYPRNSFKPFKQNVTPETIYRTSGDCVLDAPSKILILDVDYVTHSPVVTSSADLSVRLKTYIEERASFLSGKRLLVMASSSIGLEYIYSADETERKDYSKRMSIRVLVELDEAYTISQIKDEILNYTIEGQDDEGNHIPEVFDVSYFKPTQKTYIQLAVCDESTINNFKSEEVIFVDGEPLSLDEIKDKSPYRKPIKTKSAVTFKLDRSGVGSEDIKELAEELMTEGELADSKFDHFNQLNKHFAFTKLEMLPLLIEEITENQSQIFEGNYSEQKLVSSAEYWMDRTLKTIACHNEQLRNRFDKQLLLDSVDLSKGIQIVGRDAMTPQEFVKAHIIGANYLCFASDCGTAKTKGVIKNLVDHCKDTNETLLYIANTTAIVVKQAEEFEINHYHSKGKGVDEKFQTIISTRFLAICNKSLRLYSDLDIEDSSYDYVIIDEASKVLRGWDDDSAQEEDFRWLYELSNRAKHVHLYDADIDDELCSWFLTSLSNFKSENACFYINNAKRAEGYQINIAETKGDALYDLIETLDSGKKVFLFVNDRNEKGRIEGAIEFIKQYTDVEINCEWYDADKDKRSLLIDTNSYLANRLNEGLNLFVVNAWAGIGFDYYNVDHHFDKTVILDFQGWLNPKDIWQVLRRMRTCRLATVYSQFQSGMPFYKDRYKKLKHYKNFSNLSPIEDHTFRALHCHKMDMSHQRISFICQVEDRGAVIDYIPEGDNKYIKDAYDESIETFQIENGFKDNQKANRLLLMKGYFARQSDKEDELCWMNAEDDYLEDNYKDLWREFQLVNSERAGALLRAIGMTHQERIEDEKENVNSVSHLLGLLFEGFINFAVMPEDKGGLEEFLRWFLLDKNKQEIYLSTKDISETNQNEFIKILRQHKYLLGDEMRLKATASLDLNHTIKMLAKQIGLNCEFFPDSSIGEPQKRLFAFYKKVRLKGFPLADTGKQRQRKEFVFKHLMGKKGRYTELEKEYLQGLQGTYKLTKKDAIPKELYETYEKLYLRIRVGTQELTIQERQEQLKLHFGSRKAPRDIQSGDLR